MVWTGIEFYYMPASPPCRAVLMCMKELGLEVEMRKIDMYQKAEHKQPWFVKMNPQHTVPTIDDNGFILWESRAIMAYLVNKYGKESSLYPSDPTRRAVIDRMLYFDIGTLYKSIADYFHPQLMENASPDPQKANALKQSLDYLDGYLEQREYVAGEALSVADFSVLASVSQLEGMDYSCKAYTNVQKWADKLKRELPYYDECTKVGLDLFRKWVKAKTTV